MILPARFLALAVYSSSMEGRLQPITFSADRTIRSLQVSCLVAEPNQTMMEKVRTDSTMAV